MKVSLSHEKLIIGLLGIGCFAFGVYLLATNLEGMFNSVFSGEQWPIIYASLFGVAIIVLLVIGLSFMFASVGVFEYKQQSRVKIYKGDQSEECLIDRVEG